MYIYIYIKRTNIDYFLVRQHFYILYVYMVSYKSIIYIYILEYYLELWSQPGCIYIYIRKNKYIYIYIVICLYIRCLAIGLPFAASRQRSMQDTTLQPIFRSPVPVMKLCRTQETRSFSISNTCNFRPRPVQFQTLCANTYVYIYISI